MDISSMSMNEKKRFSYIILRTKSLNLYKFVLLMIALKKHLLMNYFLKTFIPHLWENIKSCYKYIYIYIYSHKKVLKIFSKLMLSKHQLIIPKSKDTILQVVLNSRQFSLWFHKTSNHYVMTYKIRDIS